MPPRVCSLAFVPRPCSSFYLRVGETELDTIAAKKGVGMSRREEPRGAASTRSRQGTAGHIRRATVVYCHHDAPLLLPLLPLLPPPLPASKEEAYSFPFLESALRVFSWIT